MRFADSFVLLQQEGYLIRTSLAQGLTALRNANLSDKGQYYAAFFGLSIGIERLLKVILILDHTARNSLNAPPTSALKRQAGRTGHDLTALFVAAQALQSSRDPHPLAFMRPQTLEHDILTMLKSHDVTGLQHTLANLLMRQGLQTFVLETITPLNRVVGEAWMRGELQVFEEHLYTEQLQAALRTAINTFPRQVAIPRILLTTFPTEQHGLGLLMVEALLVPEGVQCISLGPQTPLEDVRRAALAHKVHIVALSFSAAFPLRQATDGLASLRRQLPSTVQMWAGGEMTRRVRKTLPGIVLIPDLAASVNALRSWRAHWVPPAA